MARTLASEDAAEISKRIAELKAERLALLVGCDCPNDVHTNTVAHKPDCPLRTPLSIPLAMPSSQGGLSAEAKEILKRALNRSTRLVKSGAISPAAARSWRMRVNGTLVSLLLAMSLAFDPHILFLSWTPDRQERLNATNLSVCTQAMQAIAEGRWMADDPPAAMRCFKGNGFTAESQCIKNYNCEDKR